MLPGLSPSVPDGMARTVFIAAHHSMGPHEVQLQYIGQDGQADPSRTFRATVEVIGGNSIANVECHKDAYGSVLKIVMNLTQFVRDNR